MQKLIFPFSLFLIVFFGWIATPWGSLGGSLGISLPDVGEYRLGLDLHGGVELDYLVDYEEGDREGLTKDQVVSDIKTIIDTRVKSLGSAEPTIKTKVYSGETHILVQIPTPRWPETMTKEQRNLSTQQYIAQAKSVIGKVVNLQFKEMRTAQEIEAAQNERASYISDIQDELNTTTLNFEVAAQQIESTYENVVFSTTDIKLSQIREQLGEAFTLEAFGENGNYKAPATEQTILLNGAAQSGQVIGYVENIAGGQPQDDTIVRYSSIFISDQALEWRPAIIDGELLDQSKLISTLPVFNSTTFDVALNFTPEGEQMFGALTGRNIGRAIAIFVGPINVSAATVRGQITGGGVIQGEGSQQWAQGLSRDINEGIVPAPIYLTSERTIGPNLGEQSIRTLLGVAAISILLIAIFLLAIYRGHGIVAVICLIIYILALLAFTKLLGIVLTLSGIAGVVLSLGIAIDANILVLERIRDRFNDGLDTAKALEKGFAESWSAIWDANITGLLVGIVLWWIGVSVIEGFGKMLVLGILISLILVKFVVVPLTRWGYRKG